MLLISPNNLTCHAIFIARHQRALSNMSLSEWLIIVVASTSDTIQQIARTLSTTNGIILMTLRWVKAHSQAAKESKALTHTSFFTTVMIDLL